MTLRTKARLCIALGLALGSIYAALIIASGCGGQSTMQANDASTDHFEDELDATDATTNDDDAGEPIPGTWPWIQEGLVDGFKGRRLSWPSGFFIRMEADATYRSSSNGGSTFTTPWTPQPADTAATDWMVYQ